MQLPDNLKASINTVEKGLGVFASALLQRMGGQTVQLDVNAAPVKQIRIFKDRDADGRPYMFIQAVLFLDEDAIIMDNDRWAEILPCTDMAMPAQYRTGTTSGG